MTPKPIVLRERAQRDIDEAVEHYLSESRAAVALAFIAALEEAFRQIGFHPGSGSPRYARELDLPGLRSWMVTGFPYMVFYVEREADV
ncbi:MAG: type II toxin-antitoxin system RelE/ParE family toxin, partial [Chloroflexi bacterium]|nr:type II toxin-antitoxin system RelE/ParE family toxin [Chloroflexota bacterium]